MRGFFFLYLVLSLVNFKENYHFSRFLRGPNSFQEVVQLFPGGYNCLFPIETHITLHFPGVGGGVRTPVPPPDPHLVFISTPTSSIRLLLEMKPFAGESGLFQKVMSYTNCDKIRTSKNGVTIFKVQRC